MLSQQFLAEIKRLPIVDGHPDFSGIGDSMETVKEWVAKMDLGQEELLDQLLEYLEANDRIKAS